MPASQVCRCLEAACLHRVEKRECQKIEENSVTIVGQSAGTGMINPYGQSQLPELTIERVRLVEAEPRELRKFAYVWRQRAFIAWKKERVRKSKKTLSQLSIRLLAPA